ncbi:beta-glucosidase [Neobacillus notoginsengisoli]|uniref:Beta-glucosidase n=1 Tax=Neobacillus notoginsengisoli TaxID=1578198 RepID=A0A417YPJ0_9BACI|nr:GH1 family beta-glucosidase [Neobacillus notoginsengisoli]RHW35744.1 beta-glucosidase [Neobacillus notoginsengisoli]
MAIIQFPKNFKWGTATASYQIEGAAFKDGRGLSIWDTFSHTAGKVLNGDNGDVACDSYHRYEEDIELMKELGIDLYRFSVSWPRIFPNGMGEVNKKGLEFYHKFVDKLIENGIEPMCTLYHWDLPEVLQEKGGWANRETIDAFVHYAELMFKEFNGKIKLWITLNEPWCISFLSNYIGAHAPGNRDLQLAVQISHHLLVAHGKTVRKFRDISIDGKIGIAPNTTWIEPFSSREEDIEACRRENAYFIEWFMDPLFKGEYPQFMVEWFKRKDVEMQMNPEDMQIVQEPIDFLGINYYTGHLARFKENEGLFDSEFVEMGYERTDIGWPVYPEGFFKVLTYISGRYGNIPIYITENGSCYNEEPQNGVVADEGRIKYLKQHLTALSRSIESGVNIKGYLTWSLLDNFEWAEGYSKRFGIVHVNFRTLERTKKNSYYWYKQAISNNYYIYE